MNFEMIYVHGLCFVHVLCACHVTWLEVLTYLVTTVTHVDSFSASLFFFLLQVDVAWDPEGGPRLHPVASEQSRCKRHEGAAVPWIFSLWPLRYGQPGRKKRKRHQLPTMESNSSLWLWLPMYLGKSIWKTLQPFYCDFVFVQFFND